MFHWIHNNWDVFEGPFGLVFVVSIIKILWDWKISPLIVNKIGKNQNQRASLRHTLNSIVNLLAAILLIIGGVWSVYNSSHIDQNTINKVNGLTVRVNNNEASIGALDKIYVHREEMELVEKCIRDTIHAVDSGKKVKDTRCEPALAKYERTLKNSK